MVKPEHMTCVLHSDVHDFNNGMLVVDVNNLKRIQQVPWSRTMIMQFTTTGTTIMARIWRDCDRRPCTRCGHKRCGIDQPRNVGWQGKRLMTMGRRTNHMLNNDDVVGAMTNWCVGFCLQSKAILWRVIAKMLLVEFRGQRIPEQWTAYISNLKLDLQI